MDKFQIKRNTQSPAKFKAVQIRRDDYDLIKQMQDATGSSFVDLVSAMVQFCADRLEVVDDD